MFAVWLVIAGVLAAAVFVYAQTDRAEPSDVIIVLGAGLRRDGRPGPALIRRSARAAELWGQGYAENVICTGGYPLRSTRSEADACAELLRARGVPESAIVLEDRSRSTEENAFYARQIMDSNGWQTAIIVSDGYHLLRASWIFASTGIQATTSPAATTPPMMSYLYSIAREVVALHWQVFKTILNLPVSYVPWV